MLIRSKPRSAPQRLTIVNGAISHFMTCSEGALTSSFVVLSSAAVTVTTATVLTVGSGAEEAGARVSDTLVQIDPGQALNLNEPPYNFPADEAEDEAESGTPTVIQTEAVPPQGSSGDYNPSALIEGGEFGGGGSQGGSGGGASAPSGSGGGFAGLMIPGDAGLGGDPDEQEETTNALGQPS